MAKKRKRQIIARQIFAIVLSVAWLICIIYAFVFFSVGNVMHTPFIEIKNVPPANPEIPPIKVEIVYKMVAKGSFSAENPITITVNITNANVTNLLDYYESVAFFGSVFATQQPQYAKEGVEVPGYVTIHKQADGSYFGKATLKWHVESDVYTFLVPQRQYSFQMKVGPSVDELPLMHISPSSDTFNWKFNEITTRFTIALIGFSFLMLQPILDAIFRLKGN